MKRILKTLLIVNLCIISGCAESSTDAASASPSAAVQTYSNISLDSGFDTFISLQETTSSKTDFDAHFEEATELFTYYNSLFDIYKDYDGINNIKTINDNAGGAPVEVDPVIIEMLNKAKDFYDLTDGEFDVTMGTLLQVWHTYREEGISLNEDGEYGYLPSQSELETAASHSGWDSIVIDEDAGTVYISDPDVQLDVGGIAKGFATEKAAQALEEQNVTHAAINAGGNNRTLGSKADGSAWRVGIQNPGGEGSLAVVSIDGTNSFVTSGDYERYYVAEDGNKYHHIIDPATLYPAVHYHSVTIITPDSGDADCLSTSLFTLDYEAGLKLIQAYKDAHPDTALEAVWIMDSASAPDTEYSMISGDYTIVYTSGLKDRIVQN